jgi:hypothetical protein
MTEMMRPALRGTTWVLLAALLLVFGLGLSHRFHLVVCTGSCCAAARASSVPVPRETCSTCRCCEHSRAKTGSADREQEPGSGRHRGVCKPGCCVDLVFDVELAPAPRAVSEDAPSTHGIEPVQVAGVLPTNSWPQWLWPHDTGPPRTDKRTELRASTVLRL